MRYERSEIIQLNYGGQLVGCATLGYVAVYPAVVWAAAAIWNILVYTNAVLTITIGGVAFVARAVAVLHTTTTMYNTQPPGE